MSKFKIKERARLYDVEKQSNAGAWIGWGIAIFVLIIIFAG